MKLRGLLRYVDTCSLAHTCGLVRSLCCSCWLAVSSGLRAVAPGAALSQCCIVQLYSTCDTALIRCPADPLPCLLARPVFHLRCAGCCALPWCWWRVVPHAWRTHKGATLQ